MNRLTVFKPGHIGFEDVEEPPLRSFDVRIRVRYCGICGTDMGIYRGDSGLVRSGRIQYPKRIGHEWSGIVEHVGTDVKNFKPGDRVVASNASICGECAACRAGNIQACQNRQAIGTVGTTPGAFAETMTLPERIVYHLPDSVALDEAALIEPASIAYNGLLNFDFTKKTTLVVIGTGAIGLAAVPLAKHLGAGKVIIAGRNDVKLALGRSMGADVDVNTTQESLTEAVLRETDGRGAEAVLEASGAVRCLLDSVDFVSPKGCITTVAFYEQPLDGLNIDSLVLRGLALCGIYGHPGVMEALIALLAEDKLSLRPLITHVFSFEEAPEVSRTMYEKVEPKIKILIDMGCK